MKRAVAVLAGLLALVSVTSVVRAGGKSVWNTTVGSGYAYGQMGDARASNPNSPEYLACGVQYSPSGYYTYCVAVNAAQATAVCWTSDPALTAIAAAVSSESFLYFSYDTQTGSCSTIQVQNGSHQTPMTP